MPAVQMEVQLEVTGIAVSPNGNVTVNYNAKFGATTLPYSVQMSLPAPMLRDIMQRAETVSTNNLLQKREAGLR